MNALGICFVLVVICAVSIRGDDERCFDKEKGEAKYKPIKEKCRTEFPKGTEDRKIQIGKCVLKAMGMISDEGMLDFDKFKAEALGLAVAKKDEITKTITDCWEGATGDGDAKIKAFFECYKPGMKELCPVDAEDWNKCDEEDA